jgi:hypothetical protein
VGLKILWQLAHLLWNIVFPAAASWANIFKTEKEKKKRTVSISFCVIGLEGIIVAFELKNVDKKLRLVAKISQELNKMTTVLKIF